MVKALIRRNERLRLDLATGQAVTVTARLADRHGVTIAVPVTVTPEERDGRPYVRLDVTLAPLAPGDYAVEIQAGPDGGVEHVAVPFRVVP